MILKNDEEFKKSVNDLRELSVLLKKMKEYKEQNELFNNDDEIDKAFSELLAENNLMNEQEPKKPISPDYVKEPNAINNDDSVKCFRIFVFTLILIIVFSIISIYTLYISATSNSGYGTICFISIIITCISIYFCKVNYEGYKLDSKAYDKETIAYKEYLNKLEIYNKEFDEYCVLKKRYDDKYNELKNQFIEQVLNKITNDTNEEIKKLDVEISKYDGLISHKYYEYLDLIIEIIEDGRAKSLLDAINVFEADKRADELIRLQKEYNDNYESELKEKSRIERLREKNENYRIEQYEKDRERIEESIKRENIKREKLEAQEKWENEKLSARKERDAKHAGMSQCSLCVHYGSCSFRSNNRGNCASYAWR